MSLNAKIHRDALGNFTIQMSGSLDFEKFKNLQLNLKTIIEKNPMAQITLDLHFLEFVGSSSISNFVELINALNTPKIQIFLSNLKPEFIKVFKLFKVRDFKSVIKDMEGPSPAQKYNYQNYVGFKNSFEKD